MKLIKQVYVGLCAMLFVIALYGFALQKELPAINSMMPQEQGSVPAEQEEMLAKTTEEEAVPMQEAVETPETTVPVAVQETTEPVTMPHAVEKQEEASDQATHSEFACTSIESSEDFIPSVKKPTILYFHSRHCGACAMTKEPLNEFVRAHGSDVACYALDVDNPGVRTLAEVFKISGVPSIVAVHKFVGSMSKEVIEGALSTALGLRPPVEIQEPVSEKQETAISDEPVKDEAVRSEDLQPAAPQTKTAHNKLKFDEAVQSQALRVTPEELLEEESETFLPDLTVSGTARPQDESETARTSGQ